MMRKAISRNSRRLGHFVQVWKHWVSEGRIIRFDYRWTAGRFDRLSTYARELVSLSPDAILATNGPTLVALQGETKSIPIVFVQVIDPVAERYVTSLAHPGANDTGFTHS